jgi:hypothetical protein
MVESRVLGLLVVAAGLCGGAAPSASAVRTCGQPITGDVATAPTEVEGRRKALESWSRKAATLGPGYTSWRLANNRTLQCKPVTAPATGFSCAAFAAPCIISQVPDAPPPAAKPKRPKRLPGSTAPIET